MQQRLIPLQRSVNIPAGGASAFSNPVGDADPLHPDVLTFVDAPALTTGQLPNGETITYSLVEDNSPAFSSPTSTTVMGVQTGAGGVGAGKAVFAARLAYAGGKYFGLKITASASAAASGTSIILRLALI